MKGFAGLVLGALLVLPYAPLRAQQQQDKLEVTRAVIQAERKMIVATNLGLSESESAPFWVVYNEYHGQLTKLNDGLIKLVSDLARVLVRASLIEGLREEQPKVLARIHVTCQVSD